MTLNTCPWQWHMTSEELFNTLINQEIHDPGYSLLASCWQGMCCCGHHTQAFEAAASPWPAPLSKVPEAHLGVNVFVSAAPSAASAAPAPPAAAPAPSTPTLDEGAAVLDLAQ
jgi:hypothetical protein